MSIGVVVADSKTKTKIDSIYYIITPEYKEGGKYSDELRINEKSTNIANRKQAIKKINEWLESYKVQSLFAYNAFFDKHHLPEYSDYKWYDIMRLAAYRQYNHAIPDSADCYKTGKLKRGYKVEDILNMFNSKHEQYYESHNAIIDAHDELKIIQLLGQPIEKYDIALI